MLKKNSYVKFILIFGMNEDDLQSTAVFKSFFQSLLFITGGPGTGKLLLLKESLKRTNLFLGIPIL